MLLLTSICLPSLSSLPMLAPLLSSCALNLSKKSLTGAAHAAFSADCGGGLAVSCHESCCHHCSCPCHRCSSGCLASTCLDIDCRGRSSGGLAVSCHESC